MKTTSGRTSRQRFTSPFPRPVEIMEGRKIIHTYDHQESLAHALIDYYDNHLRPQGYSNMLRVGNTILVDRGGKTFEFAARDKKGKF